ncbi:MAG: SulP family inorganic anion transporter [Candidatus Omnitrophota bacterium]
MWKSFLPFLSWFENYDPSKLRSDFIAGLNVALVLVPQSMAYAQLAGLPVYYGLYASFLPPMMAAMFGSSHQLATGPVAVVSLMTSTALAPLAVQGSAEYISYAILLSLMVGLVQFGLGVLRMGIVVNFLSHPVVTGFTNAAALIIASSQLSKIFGVYVDSGEYHCQTIYRVAIAACSYTHFLSIIMAALAIAIMWMLKRLFPRVPNVLIAVIITSLISYIIGFERNAEVPLSAISSEEARETVRHFNKAVCEMETLSEKRTILNPKIRESRRTDGVRSVKAAMLRHEADLLQLNMSECEEKCALYRDRLRIFLFESAIGENGEKKFFSLGEVPPPWKSDRSCWRMKVGNRQLKEESLTLFGGGEVVGAIPPGLPTLQWPRINLGVMAQLLPMALIISLLGFMEAISIAKAMAAKTGQRLNPNQELIGQGVANIVGAVGQSYPVSGSFSRSAVNIQAGATTGLSSVCASVIVVIVLLFLTPWLYYLPQAVLAAIIMLAVINLIDVSAIVRAWRTQKHDGAIAVITFVFTIAFAPHLDKGIFIGVLLSLAVFLYQHMRPRLTILSKHPDGSYRDSLRWNLKRCQHICAIRFNDALFFANATYLEDKILDWVSARPHLKHVLIVGNAINELDASGEEMLSSIVDKMHDGGYEISFSGLNDAILDVMKRTHLFEKIGEDHLFRNVQAALQSIHAKAHVDSQEKVCPLLEVCLQEEK